MRRSVSAFGNRIPLSKWLTLAEGTCAFLASSSWEIPRLSLHSRKRSRNFLRVSLEDSSMFFFELITGAKPRKYNRFLR